MKTIENTNKNENARNKAMMRSGMGIMTLQLNKGMKMIATSFATTSGNEDDAERR